MTASSLFFTYNPPCGSFYISALIVRRKQENELLMRKVLLFQLFSSDFHCIHFTVLLDWEDKTDGCVKSFTIWGKMSLL